MSHLPLAAALALLAAPAIAQYQRPSSVPAAPSPAAAQPPAATSPQPAPARGANAKVVGEAKVIGKKGLLQVAPKLGKAEKIVTKQGGHVLDQAIDLLADKAGFAPVTTGPSAAAGPASPSSAQPAPPAHSPAR